MISIPDTFRKIYDLAFNHSNLFNKKLAEDPVLDEHIFAPYDPSKFVEIEGKVKSGVYATFYADEKKTEARGPQLFHGNGTSVSEIFNTYEYTVALNESLYEMFPLKSYVKVTLNGNSVIARITDNKRGKGIDLSKAVARALGGTLPTNVELQAVRPVHCDENLVTNASDKVHPMVSCYKEDVYIEFAQENNARRPSQLPANRKSAFNLMYLWFAKSLSALGMNTDTIARPFIRQTYVKENVVRPTMTVGPFKDTKAAKNYLDKYCSAAKDSMFGSLAAVQCDFAEIKAKSWFSKPKAIYYVSKMGRQKNYPTIAKLVGMEPVKQIKALLKKKGTIARK